MDNKDSRDLFEAAEKGKLEKVKEAVSNRIDVNIYNEEKNSPLTMACLNGHREIVKIIIENGAEINRINKRGANALVYACYNEHREIAEFLISKGAEKIEKYAKGIDNVLEGKKFDFTQFKELWYSDIQNFTNKKEIEFDKKIMERIFLKSLGFVKEKDYKYQYFHEGFFKDRHIDFLILRNGKGVFLFEDKKTIKSNAGIQRAFKQASRYAQKMNVKRFGIASPEGLRLYEGKKTITKEPIKFEGLRYEENIQNVKNFILEGKAFR
ncbi:MAG: ankyrin repeat domain-containing protein [Candidatus Coatesbacteria bacterium]|nr:ankyrin repeat domain-containing protein [Candidatus Coatesbacteria bacterium]